MKQKFLSILIVILFGGTVFCVWEYAHFYRSSAVYFDRGAGIFQGRETTLFLGETSSVSGQRLQEMNQSFMRPQDVIFLRDIQENQVIRWPDFLVYRGGGAYAFIDFEDHRFLFLMKELSSKDLSNAPFSFESDYWILTSSFLPQKITPPEKGIIFIGKRASSRLQSFAQEKNIPLFAPADWGFLSLSFVSGSLHVWTEK